MELYLRILEESKHTMSKGNFPIPRSRLQNWTLKFSGQDFFLDESKSKNYVNYFLTN